MPFVYYEGETMESELYKDTTQVLHGTIGVLSSICASVMAAIYINIYAGFVVMLLYLGIIMCMEYELREIRRDF